MRTDILGLSIAAVIMGGGLGLFLITWNVLDYFQHYESVPFILAKGELAHSKPWQTVLAAHIISGVFCLFACVSQFSRKLRRMFPDAHRLLGWMFCGLMLVGVIPTGIYLALYAIGGVLGTTGFLFNALLALLFTLLGIGSMRKKQVHEHAAWMTRAFAMAATAVTFRYLHLLFKAMDTPPMTDYLLSLWGSIIINYILAEFFIAQFSRFHPASSAELHPA